MGEFVIVKVMVPVDAPLGAALAQKPARMRAGFLRAMAEIGHQQQSGAAGPAVAHAIRAPVDPGNPARVSDGAPPVAPQEVIALRRAW